MIGICGIILKSDENVALERNIKEMTENMVSGPSIQHSWLVDGSVALGAAGFETQMSGARRTSVDGSPFCMTVCGNFYEGLPKDLTKKTCEDYCDVLMREYLRKGTNFFDESNGEFVIGVWDGREKSLYLATDLFRTYGLYYYEDPEKLIFSSDMKQILRCPVPVNQEIDLEAVVDFVGSSMIPTPKAIFKNVKKMPAGHVLKYKNGATRLKPYWHASFLNPCRNREKALAEEFNTILREAVQRRCGVNNAERGIGTFLSGGVDSSSLTGILADTSGSGLKSFSIGFGEEKFNEMEYARIAARAFRVQHYEHFVSPKDTLEAIPILAETFDEPYGNASALGAYFCGKMAKNQGVDILLSGDGGDELFAGNQRYADQELFEYYKRVPKKVRDYILKPGTEFFAAHLPFKVFEKGKKYIQRATIPYHKRITSYDFFHVVPMDELLDEAVLDAVGAEYDPYFMFGCYYFEAPAQQTLDRHLYLDWKLTIMDNDLIKFRMSHRAGIEVRFPYLDRNLVEFSVKVPARIKMRGRRLRSFQKKALSGLLPKEIREKKKHGFGLPIPIWLRTDRALNEVMRDLVLSPRSIQRGYFKKAALEKLVKDHSADETSFYGTALWNLMMLELWLRKMIDKKTDW
jgi:asparagine synthase (glutamine-hydrolysing)